MGHKETYALQQRASYSVTNRQSAGLAPRKFYRGKRPRAGNWREYWVHTRHLRKRKVIFPSDMIWFLFCLAIARTSNIRSHAGFVARRLNFSNDYIVANGNAANRGSAGGVYFNDRGQFELRPNPRCRQPKRHEEGLSSPWSLHQDDVDRPSRNPLSRNASANNGVRRHQVICGNGRTGGGDLPKEPCVFGTDQCASGS